MSRQRGQTDDNLPDSEYCLAFNSRSIARAVTKLYDRELAPSGIRSTQLAVLLALTKSQPVSMGALAESLRVDTTTLSRNLSLMRRQRLVTISERSTMRRRFVALTSNGARAVQGSIPLWRKVQARFVKTIGNEHWKVVQNALSRLSETARILELRNQRQVSRR